MQDQNSQPLQQSTQGDDVASPPAPQAPPSQKDESSVGPVVSIVIVLVILVAGALYLWFTRASGPSLPETTTADEILAEPDEQLEALQVTSPSDTIEAIESDLDATDLNNLDSELDSIDSLLDETT